MNEDEIPGENPPAEESALRKELPVLADVWPTRRQFIGQMTGCAIGAIAFQQMEAQISAQTPSPLPAETGLGRMMKVAFTVNGKPSELELDTRTTLLDAL